MLLTRLREYRPGRLARNAMLGSFWQGIRVILQSLWVVVIARELAVDGYGTFSGLAGLASSLGGFTGLGLGLVMHQVTSLKPASFGPYWRNALRITFSTGALFSGLFALIIPQIAFKHLTPMAIGAIGVAELLCFPVATLCAFAFAAHERAGWSAGIPALLAAARLMAALCFQMFASTYDLPTFAQFHLAGSAIAAVVSLAIVMRLLRPARCGMPVSLRDVREGFGFSAIWASGIALASLDKSLVLHFSGSTIAGLYASAYRFASVLSQPMDALTSAATPRLYRRSLGDEHHPGLLWHLVLATLGYSTTAGFLLFACAGVLPILLGDAFAAAVPAVHWMALFLPCYGLRTLGTNVLMASGRKKFRLLLESTGLLSLLLFAIIWLPAFGLLGAVVMIVTTEATLAGLVWLGIWLAHKANR
jgi:O-antigen/teichoic acid export membrane protein